MDLAARLFETHAKRAWGLAFALTRHSADAEDVVQAAFVVAVQKRHDIPAEPWPWLAAVVANCARNHGRRSARSKTMESAYDLGKREDNHPERLASRAEAWRAIKQTLDQLAPEEREAIALCHIGGLTQEEAGEVSGTNVNTLKARVRRGLAKLKDSLKLHQSELEAALASVVFPMPAGGWDSALARWQARALVQSAGPGPWPVPKTTIAMGAAGLALLIGFGAWAFREESGSAASNRGAGELSLDGQDAPAPNSIASSSMRPMAGGEAGVAPGTLPERQPVAQDLPRATPGSGRREVVVPPQPGLPGSLQVRTVFYASGEVEAQWTELVTDGEPLPHGTFTLYWINGNIRETGEYVRGFRERLWVQRYRDNGLHNQGEYVQGRKSGVWRFFDESGALVAEGSYENGLQEGTFKRLHPNGLVKALEPFAKGKRDGLAVHYDDQGRKRRETSWRNDRKHGVETEYDDQGNVVSRKTFADGKALTADEPGEK